MMEYTFSELILGKSESLLVNITPDSIDEFSKLSGDYSSIHIDNLYANNRGFKSRLVHGVLIQSYISAFIGMRLPGKHGLLQSMSCQFRLPCYAPNRLNIVGVVNKRSEAMRVVGIQITVSDLTGNILVTGLVNSVLHF